MISIRLLFHLDVKSQNGLSNFFLTPNLICKVSKNNMRQIILSTLYGLYPLEYITNHSRFKLLKSCFNHFYNPIIVCLENNIMCNILQYNWLKNVLARVFLLESRQLFFFVFLVTVIFEGRRLYYILLQDMLYSSLMHF